MIKHGSGGEDVEGKILYSETSIIYSVALSLSCRGRLPPVTKHGSGGEDEAKLFGKAILGINFLMGWTFDYRLIEPKFHSNGLSAESRSPFLL